MRSHRPERSTRTCSASAPNRDPRSRASTATGSASAGAQLHLVDAPPGPAGIRPAGNHYCVAVDDLDGAIAELETRGIEYRRGAQGDVVQIWFVDPAGNTIELQQDR